MSAGTLVLAASISFLAGPSPAAAQFPIRQIPQARPAAQRQTPLLSPPTSSQGPVTTNQVISPPGSASLAPSPQPPIPRPTALPAVPRITVVEKDGISYGSGTLVDVRGEFGLVVSNWHVVRDAAGPITAEFADGFKSPAEVVKTDKDWDLAALSIYRPRSAPMPISSVAPQLGEP